MFELTEYLTKSDFRDVSRLCPDVVNIKSGCSTGVRGATAPEKFSLPLYWLPLFKEKIMIILVGWGEGHLSRSNSSLL